MELGEKLRLARQEAGLSQRQLCGDVITRNMLSQIEHGTARPSMETLRYLASRLEKPISFFLEEDVVLSPNQGRMAAARAAFASGDIAATRENLARFRQPDETLEWEWKYLSCLTALAAAGMAAQEEKYLYARQLLEEASVFCGEFAGLERQGLLLLGRIPGADLSAVVSQLPSLDEELLLRAEEVLSRDPERAQALLAAAEDHDSPRWNLLWGTILLQKKDYAKAAAHLQQAEVSFPQQCWPMLEECFRETGDYQAAYQYACKQR